MSFKIVKLATRREIQNHSFAFKNCYFLFNFSTTFSPTCIVFRDITLYFNNVAIQAKCNCRQYKEQYVISLALKGIPFPVMEGSTPV